MGSYAETKYIKLRRHKNVIYNDFGYLLSYSQSCIIPIFVKWSGNNNSVYVSVCLGYVGVFWPALELTKSVLGKSIIHVIFRRFYFRYRKVFTNLYFSVWKANFIKARYTMESMTGTIDLTQDNFLERIGKETSKMRLTDSTRCQYASTFNRFKLWLACKHPELLDEEGNIILPIPLSVMTIFMYHA